MAEKRSVMLFVCAGRVPAAQKASVSSISSAVALEVARGSPSPGRRLLTSSRTGTGAAIRAEKFYCTADLGLPIQMFGGADPRRRNRSPIVRLAAATERDVVREDGC